MKIRRDLEQQRLSQSVRDLVFLVKKRTAGGLTEQELIDDLKQLAWSMDEASPRSRGRGDAQVSG